jgi:hypothetical protein
VVLRITLFKLSIAFVVLMIFRTAGGKAKNGTISCHARRHGVIPPESKGLRKWNFLGKMHEEILNEVDQI